MEMGMLRLHTRMWERPLHCKSCGLSLVEKRRSNGVFAVVSCIEAFMFNIQSGIIRTTVC